MKKFGWICLCLLTLNCSADADFNWDVYDCDIGLKFVQVSLPEAPHQYEKEGIHYFVADEGESRYCLAVMGKRQMFRSNQGELLIASLGEGLFPEMDFENLTILSASEEPKMLDITTQALEMELLDRKTEVVFSMCTVISLTDPFVYVLISQEPLDLDTAHNYFTESFNRRPEQ